MSNAHRVGLLAAAIFLFLSATCQTPPPPPPEKKDPPPPVVDEVKRKPYVQVHEVMTLGEKLFAALKENSPEKCLELFPPFEELSRTLEEEDLVEYSMNDYPRLRVAYEKAFTSLVVTSDFKKAEYKSLSKGQPQTLNKKTADGEKITFYNDNKLVFMLDGEEKTISIPVILLIDDNFYIPILYR